MLGALKWFVVLWQIRRGPSWSERAYPVAALARDHRVPWRVRPVPPLLAAHIATPPDLVPDFVPAIGRLDDLAAIGLALRFVQRSLPHGLIEEPLESAGDRSPS